MGPDTEELKSIIVETGLESEKLDTAQTGIDAKDIPDLETEEKVAKRQKGQGLKIMTTNQMIIRLPI